MRNAEKQARIVYCASMLAMVYDDSVFLSNVWFSDESRVYLYRFLTRLTVSFLGFKRPDVTVEKHQHSHGTVWCTASAYGISGSYFVADDHENSLSPHGTEKKLSRRDLRRLCHERNLTQRGNRFVCFIKFFKSRNYPCPSHSPDVYI